MESGEQEEGWIENRRSKGTWKHAAFHVATTIATPAAYAPLPFALASLGWSLGVFSLVGGTLVTWYSSLIISSLWAWNGEEHTTYRQLSRSIFGSWGYWAVSFFQQVASLGNNIAIHIAAGTSLKAVYKYFHENGALTLQEFIIFFGVFELFLSQFPDIHSLRWVNALCTCSTVGFAGTTIGLTLYNGKKIERGSVNYHLEGDLATKIFKAFNALGTIAFSFGDAMLPEIQIYCRPTYAYFEENMLSKDQTGLFRIRNRLVRLFATSLYMVLITCIAAAMPFFGDFVAICGAVGFTPLDFVMPLIAYVKVGKLPKNRSLGLSVKALNLFIAVWFSGVAILGCIGAVRFTVKDAQTYKFFYDM
ncbi:GABA transporter 1 isoform X3 [Amborella trichopoda]|uniref:GABA transporter 1 isoform X3 n=1 Tax=Amborella trichopoda TaxID=13333 RepID=UPI0009BD8783|nr:GABA transporter 1 isoform X3 [Amborella trichopoda]|eukprot:XP_020519783.1 GABA transporter 1 isoform X3 [Amborella trichopoda]